MLHSHNHSVPLAGHRRAVYYPPTGTGRDTYIINDNGGTNIKYRTQGVQELGGFMKFGKVNSQIKPSSGKRYQKYVSDGSGRDNYVVDKHGGQFTGFKQCNKTLGQFFKTIREHKVLPFGQLTRERQKDPQLSFYQTGRSRVLSVPKSERSRFEDIVRHQKQRLYK